jgi:hypothetical protein
MGGKGVRYTWPVGVYERKGEEGGRGAKAERDGEEKETCGREERRGRRWDRGWGGGARADEEKGTIWRGPQWLPVVALCARRSASVCVCVCCTGPLCT